MTRGLPDGSANDTQQAVVKGFIHAVIWLCGSVWCHGSRGLALGQRFLTPHRCL
jgi:hypothetical protein